MSHPSTKPYLVRAIYEWCMDGGFTPYISVQVDGVTRVPLEFVKDGMIVLNCGPSATRNLTMSNERVEFYTRFNGVSREVSVPVAAITGIFARENGDGLVFQVTAPAEGEAIDSPRLPDAPEVEPSPVARDAAPASTLAGVAPGTPPQDPPPASPPKGRASLRVIK